MNLSTYTSPYSEYANFTVSTAIYPSQVAAPYLALGLCSEAAECIELLFARKSNPIAIGHELGGETGDIQWYVARLAATYNLSFDALVQRAKRRYVQGNMLDLHSTLDGVTMHAGLIAGKVKKQLRDGASWTGEQREEARRYIEDQLVNIVMLSMRVCDWLYAHHNAEYSSYDKLLQMNRKKLESRQRRGALSGDGNNR